MVQRNRQTESVLDGLFGVPVGATEFNRYTNRHTHRHMKDFSVLLIKPETLGITGSSSWVRTNDLRINSSLEQVMMLLYMVDPKRITVT